MAVGPVESFAVNNIGYSIGVNAGILVRINVGSRSARLRQLKAVNGDRIFKLCVLTSSKDVTAIRWENSYQGEALPIEVSSGTGDPFTSPDVGTILVSAVSPFNWSFTAQPEIIFSPGTIYGIIQSGGSSNSDISMSIEQPS